MDTALAKTCDILPHVGNNRWRRGVILQKEGMLMTKRGNRWNYGHIRFNCGSATMEVKDCEGDVTNMSKILLTGSILVSACADTRGKPSITTGSIKYVVIINSFSRHDY